MRVPLEWLADYVDWDLDTHDLAARMTMGGLKVEAVERMGVDWTDVVVGHVVELWAHPSSKKPLTVTRVDIGSRIIQVVTGAPNVSLHDKVPVVLVGGVLPHGPDGEPMTIVSKPMAGITSDGMLASQYELGISDEHSGIYVLASDAPVGGSLRTFMGGDVLDIETHPNRPDTLSMIGIARDVAAMTLRQLTVPSDDVADADIESVDRDSIRVDVHDPDLCPRYTALRIEGVEVVPSPGWLSSRLEAAGMRPINLLVDITNYVLLEYGQPLHAFDAAHLASDTIIVRRARAEERLRTLDGEDRRLCDTDLVIADGERTVAIAGVMGGENSEIGPDTKAIVLESATFDGPTVRRSAKRLGLRTEASSRFEKGLPPEQASLAARRYLQLLAQITGKRLRVYRLTDAWTHVPGQRVVTMPMRDLDRLSGVRIDRDAAGEKLNLLGFDVDARDDSLSVTVPYWRRADIALSADLVEEVVRLVGYDAVPPTLPRRTLPPPAPRSGRRYRDLVRERLLGIGISETVGGALTSTAAMERLLPLDLTCSKNAGNGWESVVVNAAGIYAREALTKPLVLINPPSNERDLLRVTLLPALLDVVSRNLKHSDENLAFFEMALTYFPRRGELPYERETLGIVLSGLRRPRRWQETTPGPFAFYDVKGVVSALLDDLRVEEWSVEPAKHPALHPGRSAGVRVRGGNVAVMGELHPLVAAAFEIEPWAVQVAEVDLDSLFAAASERRAYRP
ncbi:MAG: phenylalanine--tRNA ligase subunit beta, partial [Chloroflexi bacterium]